jgi:hypothetical protein
MRLVHRPAVGAQQVVGHSRELRRLQAGDRFEFSGEAAVR